MELAQRGRFIDQGLTGWDLAGPESRVPDPLLHARSFEAARANGLRLTIHAGEWDGAAQVRRSLVVKPERIAHGPGAIQDEAPVPSCERAASRSTWRRPRTGKRAACHLVAEHPIGPLYRRACLLRSTRTT